MGALEYVLKCASIQFRVSHNSSDESDKRRNFLLFLKLESLYDLVFFCFLVFLWTVLSEEKLLDDDLDDKRFTCQELEDRELPLMFSIRSSVEVLRISRTSFAMSAFIL